MKKQVMVLKIFTTYSLDLVNTNLCKKFRIILKFMRNQCRGQRKYLTVQLNSWPVRRKELKTNVCDANFLGCKTLQNIWKWFRVQIRFYWIARYYFSFWCFKNTAGYTTRRWRKKNNILFFDHYNKLNTRQFRY